MTGFKEKPEGDGGWVSGGFFVVEPEAIDLIEDDSTIWERGPMERLAETQELRAHYHHGFWQPMDTLRDKRYLENLWETECTVEGVVMDNFWKDKTVLITGHRIQRGVVVVWLTHLGAKVFGFSKEEGQKDNLYSLIKNRKLMEESIIGDINKKEELEKVIKEGKTRYHLSLCSPVSCHRRI